MIAEERPYRMGWRALVFMIASKQKYPLMFAFGVAILGVFLYLTRNSIPAGAVLVVLHRIQQYGTVFTIFLAIFLGLTVLPEYFGMSFLLGDKALYLRSGILSHRVIAIERTKVRDVVLEEGKGLALLGLRRVSIITGDHRVDDQTQIPAMHAALARGLHRALLEETLRV